MPSTSTLPQAEAPRLPCPAHAPGYAESRGAAVAAEPPHAQPASKTQPVETYQADRALHALAARLTGGISPVALSLAFIDWASHLAAAPQRRTEIAQEGMRDAAGFFETAMRCFAPGQGPWSLIKPKPQDRRFAAPEWESPPFNLLAQVFLLREQRTALAVPLRQAQRA